ncbi:MAG TPA: PfkB family carbohydrate kinase, partial [Armatimonadota bacterium]|nr:PfkB family carbohydrate kinase [Armatimonadota bacterium]
SSFRNFAELCITRQIITAIKTATRNKHTPLNQYVSFSATPASAMDGEPTVRLLARARQLGATTSMDTAFNPNVDAAALIEPCLPHLDVFIPSIEEAQAITGESDPGRILDTLDGHGTRTLGVKLGAEGCLIRSSGETRRHAAFEVGVVDGSGAGDAFFAGYLYGVLQGWGADESACFANATAAHCIQAIGCSAGVPTAEEVRAFMRAVAR